MLNKRQKQRNRETFNPLNGLNKFCYSYVKNASFNVALFRYRQF